MALTLHHCHRTCCPARGLPGGPLSHRWGETGPQVLPIQESQGGWERCSSHGVGRTRGQARSQPCQNQPEQHKPLPGTGGEGPWGGGHG